jgi:hypothetical protein
MMTQITVNSVYIYAGAGVYNVVRKGDSTLNYFFGANLTISGDIPYEFTLIMYLGKDRNSLVEIFRDTVPYYVLPPSPTFEFEYYGTVLQAHGYNTIDDLLNKAGVSNLTSCVFCIKIIWDSGEAINCATISIVQPQATVTINDVYLTRDGYRTSTMNRGESLDRYAIYFSVTVSGAAETSANIIVKAGKDQNNLKTIGGYGQTVTSGTYVIPMRMFSIIYPTTDDFLNTIGATDSCVVCVTIS